VVLQLGGWALSQQFPTVKVILLLNVTKENLGVGARIILEWILERWDGAVLTGLIWLGIGTSGGLL
jgi:hypothetical protein